MPPSTLPPLPLGFYTTQTNVRWVLEQPMPADQYPQCNLPDDLPNLATAAKAAGYEVVYKGKMHLTKPANPDYTWSSVDAANYGFKRWNFPDSGANTRCVQRVQRSMFSLTGASGRAGVGAPDENKLRYPPPSPPPAPSPQPFGSRRLARI